MLKPGINEATIRLLTRLGIEVVVPKGESCCGSLVHHMGREEAALDDARRNVDAWMRELDTGRTRRHRGDRVRLRHDDQGLRLHAAGSTRDYKDKAARVSALAKDITEYLASIDLPDTKAACRADALPIIPRVRCNMGRKSSRQPKDLLKAAGFVVKEPAEGHLCCGSAGTYNIMQADIARTLRDRKVRNIEATGASLIATGNIGCITQIAGGSKLPIVHTVELLDWAYGGPKPEGVQVPGASYQAAE